MMIFHGVGHEVQIRVGGSGGRRDNGREPDGTGSWG